MLQREQIRQRRAPRARRGRGKEEGGTGGCRGALCAPLLQGGGLAWAGVRPSVCPSIHTRAGVAVRPRDLSTRTRQGERAHYFWCPPRLLTAPWNRNILFKARRDRFKYQPWHSRTRSQRAPSLLPRALTGSGTPGALCCLGARLPEGSWVSQPVPPLQGKSGPLQIHPCAAATSVAVLWPWWCPNASTTMRGSGTRLFPSAFSLWMRTPLVPNATGASPGQLRAGPWSLQSAPEGGCGQGSLRGAQPGSGAAPRPQRRLPPTPGDPRRGDALLASYESLIASLLAKEQTKLCRNSPRRALMPDWISGEEGWAFFFLPPALYLAALPLRGGSGAEPARPHGDQLGGLQQGDLWWSQGLGMHWDVLSGDWMMLGAEPWLFPLSVDQPARRWR